MPRGAVCPGVGEKMEVWDLELEAPRAGEVKVRMAATGVCHSDLSIQNGTIMFAFPVVLGHEGAGIVEEVGEGVTDLEPGDHVVLSFVPQCGQCFFCSRSQGFLCELAATGVMTGGLLDGTPRFSREGLPVRQMSCTGLFAESTVVPAIGAVKVPDDIPLKSAALIGCGVLTGVGAAINTAEINEGDAVAVVGCGGVGLNIIQGARIAGAGEIIAVDMVPAKLELARQFGATQTVNAAEGDPLSGVMDLTGQRGADVAFEAIGLQQTIDQTIRMARRGGQAIIVGVPRMDANIDVPAFLGMVASAKTIKGCWYGSSNVHRDVPRLVELYQAGQLKLDELISRTITLDEVNDAFEAMERGEVARSVIEYAS